MSQRITPYWNGNVAHLIHPSASLSSGPDTKLTYGTLSPIGKPLAKVIPLFAPVPKRPR